MANQRQQHNCPESAWLLDGLGAAVLCGLAVVLASAGAVLWLAWRVW